MVWGVLNKASEYQVKRIIILFDEHPQSRIQYRLLKKTNKQQPKKKPWGHLCWKFFKNIFCYVILNLNELFSIVCFKVVLYDGSMSLQIPVVSMLSYGTRGVAWKARDSLLCGASLTPEKKGIPSNSHSNSWKYGWW